jgi:hypothetical protein
VPNLKLNTKNNSKNQQNQHKQHSCKSQWIFARVVAKSVGGVVGWANHKSVPTSCQFVHFKKKKISLCLIHSSRPKKIRIISGINLLHRPHVFQKKKRQVKYK